MATKKLAPAPALDTEVEPLTFVSTPDEEREPERRVVLFTIDGKAYSIPKKFPVGLGLKIIRTVRLHGEELAMAELLSEVLGDDAYDALINYRDLTPENLMDLMLKVRELALGGLQGPKASSKSA